VNGGFTPGVLIPFAFRMLFLLPVEVSLDLLWPLPFYFFCFDFTAGVFFFLFALNGMLLPFHVSTLSACYG
jgi:hypothetical protein